MVGQQQQVSAGCDGHVMQGTMAARACPGFDALGWPRPAIKPSARELHPQFAGHSFAMHRPIVGLRLQAMVHMEGNDSLLRRRPGDGMEQRRRIEAAAEGDRYCLTGSISGSWCRRIGHRPAGARSDGPAVRWSSGR
eukprot:m.925523 g.925523  ORF g.925523 m.925523 type:complete len:137 (-) comp132159_c0_seq1:1039-1449(-)